MAVKLTIRDGSKVERSSHDSVAGAVEAMRARLAQVDPSREPVKVLGREFDPVGQVAARGEIAGGPVRGGVDLRGDGSSEAWTGRWRRAVVEARRGEDAYDALLRELS